MTDPTPLSPRRARRLRTRLGASKRRAAVATSAALLSAGAFSTVTSGPDDAEPASAYTVPVHTVSLAEPAEAAPLTLLPVDTVDATPVSSPAVEPVATLLGEGRASYYGRELAGNPTASGERFDPSDLTAAHRTLPFGTLVRVTNVRTGKSVVVRINDRGPFHEDRVIDVSRAAADEIGLTHRGTGTVRLERLETARGVRG